MGVGWGGDSFGNLGVYSYMQNFSSGRAYGRLVIIILVVVAFILQAVTSIFLGIISVLVLFLL